MSERVDVADLLTIDVGSELRKLATAQLQGSWQLPAELLRHALRAGAHRVQVELGRQRVSITSELPVISRSELEDLIELADAAAPPPRRHEALLNLERAGGPGLLSLVGLRPQRLEIVSGGGDVLTLTAGRRGQLRTTQPGGGTQIVAEGLRLDRGRAREWLTDVARFAMADITLDGRELRRGFERAISRAKVHDDPRVDVAIPAEGDVARVWLLMNGVVATHASVSPAPCFEASIEMSGFVEATATAADVRAAFDRLVPDLVQAVVGHLCEVAGRLDTLPATLRPRITELMLEAARMRRYESVMSVPLFFGRDARGRDRWFCLTEIAERLDGGDRSLAVLSARQDPDDHVIDDLVLFLEESERASLARLMDVNFQPPRHRHELRPRGALGSLKWREVRRRWGNGIAALLWRSPPVDDATLRPEERSFLRSLRGAVGKPGDSLREVDIVDGAGPVRHAGSRLLLPRDNPEVSAAIRRFAGDPSHVYLCALAWLDGIQAPTTHAREAWQRRHDPLAAPRS